MKRLALVVLTVVGLLAAVVPLAFFIDTEDRPAPQVVPGFDTFSLTVPHRNAPLNGFVWYPTQASQSPDLLGQNALFYGHYVQTGAPATDAALPLVVLSHGSGGNAVQLGWLASQLANAGFVVAAVNHAGTTSRDSDPHRTPMIWERAADLTALVDHIIAGTDGPRIDATRVGALGFSLGGYSALGVSGVRLSKVAFIDYCDRNAGLVDCGWMQAAGVDFDAIDQTRYEGDYRDPRISAVAVIDPALPQAMTEPSLKGLEPAALIINLGTLAEIPEAMRADAVAKTMPDALYRTIPGSAHFSALPECSLLGVLIIATAGDDNICSDKGLRPRSDIQTEIGTAIVAFFKDRL